LDMRQLGVVASVSACPPLAGATARLAQQAPPIGRR